jgi:ell wall binding domain 2 (CWB2)
MVRAMRARTLLLLLALAVGGCGGRTTLLPTSSNTTSSSVTQTAVTGSQSTATPSTISEVPSTTPPQRLGFPMLATKNTTRVNSSNPITDAAAVALAVYPSVVPGTHPPAVVLAPTDDWQAALAASSLMAAPFRAPLLLSTPGSLPTATSAALSQLAPTGDGSLDGTQLIRVGDVPSPSGLKAGSIDGSNPYALAAAIDRFEGAARGKASVNVVIASADAPGYAMPAAGWAAESGEPILFVSSSGVPGPTREALLAHGHAHIFVLGPASVIPDSVLAQLQRYGIVARVGAIGPGANSVAFTEYRDPPCAYGQPCVHVPGSFGWAIRSPGHGYVLLSDRDPLVAAAASALSSSGGYGPQLLVENPNTLPHAVLNYLLDYATPGYTQEGPTAAVYNHAWLVGDQHQISLGVQAQVDSLLEAVPQR